MSDTSVIQDILWLVQQSEDAYPAVNGVEMHQHVRIIYSAQVLFIYLSLYKQGKREYFLIKSNTGRSYESILN